MIVVRKLSGKPVLEFYFVGEKPLKYKVKFQEENKKLRISKIIYSKGLIQPRKFKKKLRNQKLFLSLDKETQKIANGLEEMLFNLNLKFEWIQLCRFCLIDGRISPLKERFSYDNEDICFRCAKREVMRELRYRGISANLDVVLRKKKNVREVLKILDPRMSLDEGQTLFDEIPADSDTKEVEELEIPDKFKRLFRKRIKRFHPVQILALENGVLEGESMFVSSATASGKTLVGELGGISEVFKGKKFLFLVPLVALANQKYEEFKKNYPFRVAIRVGMSRIKVREELVVEDTDLDADVIVGTYEGVDFVLRSSRDLGDVGCVVIDEIHTLSDPERGPRLDSLISRL
ncbi:MAG: DEAD/DEAH box helicase, partial [Candidatus Methanofastidiosia archaeon]